MLVSVIIPTFNRLWCLPRAVESCRKAGCPVEIIVVDDGSSDGTWEWLQTQDDVIGIRQENWGKDWAVQAGTARSSGQYVRFLDSDDWLLPNGTSKQLHIAVEECADVVVAGTEIYNEAEELIESSLWHECDDFIAQQLGECDSSHYSAYLFRREFILNIPHRQEFGARDDRMFIIEVALAKPRVSVCRERVFAHMHHELGRLQFPKGSRAVVTNYYHSVMYRKALGTLDRRGELTARRKKAAAKILWPLAHWIAYSDREEGAEVADWVLSLDPAFEIPEKGILGWLYRVFGFRRVELMLGMRRRVLTLISKVCSR
ncbi:MAG: glycosyltransferase family 2 protein [Chthoniobacterales bacterium]